MAENIPSLDKKLDDLAKNPDVSQDMARFRDMVSMGVVGAKRFDASMPPELPKAPDSNNDQESWKRFQNPNQYMDLGKYQAFGTNLQFNNKFAAFAYSSPQGQAGNVISGVGVDYADRLEFQNGYKLGFEATLGKSFSSNLLGNQIPSDKGFNAAFATGLEHPSGLGGVGLSYAHSNIEDYVGAAVNLRFRGL